MNTYIANPPELYHYGIKGMKWGIRKTPEQRAQKYRNKKVAKLKDRQSRDLYEARERYAGNSREIKKAVSAINREYSARINRAMHMSISDIKAEKRYKAASAAKTALKVVGGIAATATAGISVLSGLSAISRANSRATMTTYWGPGNTTVSDITPR